MIRNHLAPVLVALAAIAAAALFLPAGHAQAQGSYKFRMVNEISMTNYLRCGASGDWTSVSGGSTVNLTCSGSTGQWRFGTAGAAVNATNDCEDTEPVLRIRVAPGYSSPGVYVACIAE